MGSDPQGLTPSPPTDFPWGREVHIVDPGGVYWPRRLTVGGKGLTRVRPLASGGCMSPTKLTAGACPAREGQGTPGGRGATPRPSQALWRAFWKGGSPHLKGGGGRHVSATLC